MKAQTQDTVTSTTTTGTATAGPLADPSLVTWQVAAPAGGNVVVTFQHGGAVILTLTLSIVEAHALGAALAGLVAGGGSTTLTGAQTLPLASILIASNAAFAAAGQALVGGQIVNYTSTDATHLLGATGGVGLIAGGAAVTGLVAGTQIAKNGP